MANSSHTADAHPQHEHHGHGTMYYVKIYLLLLVLFAISVAGPMLEIRVLTIITAFGIALVKALIVCAYFMHLKIEKKFVHYVLYTMLLAVAMFFLGVMTDIMKPTGHNWVKGTAIQLIEDHKNNPRLSDPHYKPAPGAKDSNAGKLENQGHNP